ncbi:glycosyltransferase family 2 protein [Laceyella putida]|uniref:Glycosyltransferase family 2 protein n=1 Tax=Laceyella putida TaxID=110101 RepID=A0ABW2RKU1_9BACL
MLTFILDNEDPWAMAKTTSCLGKTPCEIVPLKTEIAWRMQACLTHYREPFFLTFRAGDQIKPGFFQKMGEWIRDLSENCAGLMAGTKEGLLLPLVWRTKAVKSLSISKLDHFPFEHYALQDLQSRLSVRWRWKEVDSDHYLPNPVAPPKWMNRETEWQLTKPLLYTRPPAARMNGRPTVSIVICTYNDGGYLSWAIRSVWAQTNPDWELIVVNDGSTDQTREVLSSFQGEPRLTVIENGKNLGKAKSLNRALGAAKGEWLLELDADDWLTVDCVEQICTHASKRPHATLFYGNHHEWRERANKTLVYSGLRHNPSPINKEELLSTGLPLAPRCYNTSILRKMGGWLCSDPFEGRLYEDFQMLLRLEKQDKVHIPLALYHRRIRKNSITHREAEKYAIWKNWVKEKGSAMSEP